jgi:hypothetical protein
LCGADRSNDAAAVDGGLPIRVDGTDAMIALRQLKLWLIA